MTNSETERRLRRASAYSRITLMCNAAILTANFVVVLATAAPPSEGVSRTVDRVNATYAVPDPAPTCLRVVQAIEGSASAGDVGPDQLRCVHSAVLRYYEVVGRGVPAALRADGDAVRVALADLCREARDEVERELGSSFRDGALVTRLTTEILRECR